MTKQMVIFAFFLISILTHSFGQSSPMLHRYSYNEANDWAQGQLEQMTLDEKVALISGEEYFYIPGAPRLGIPRVLSADATMGVMPRLTNYGYNSGIYEKTTAFPSTVTLASTWNRQLSNECAKAVAEEARAGGIGILLDPGMNIYRTSTCGRNFEYMGEDPFLTSEMVRQYVKGLNEIGVMATIEHFIANDQEFMGLYDKDWKSDDPRLEEHHQVALETAREGMVLSKNKNGILPVQSEAQNILLTGNYLDKPVFGGGAAHIASPYNPVTLREAVINTFGARINVSKQATDEQVTNAEIVILNIGAFEREGQGHPFEIPEREEKEMRRISALDPNALAVMNSGSGKKMARWIDGVAGLIQAWYPGEAGNQALAEILSGAVNPSGKLPITMERDFSDAPHGYSPELPGGGRRGFIVRAPNTDKTCHLRTNWADDDVYDCPKYDEEKSTTNLDVPYNGGVLVGYRWHGTKQIGPLCHFGHGLSYSAFEYARLNIKQEKDFNCTVGFHMKNTGKEVGQVYIHDQRPSVYRPSKELKGFQEVELKSGESKMVTIKLSKDNFSFYDINTNKWIAEPGKFKILIGSSSGNI